MTRKVFFKKCELKSKKGFMSFNIVMMIPRFIFLTIVILAVVLLIRSFVISRIDVKDIESDLFVERAMFSPSGFNHYDSGINRVYPGVIDLHKFNELSLSRSIVYASSQVLAANISLYKDAGGSLKLIKHFYYNENWYQNWYPRTVRQLPGPGGVQLKEYMIPAVIKDNEDYIKGFVEFKVIIPNN